MITAPEYQKIDYERILELTRECKQLTTPNHHEQEKRNSLFGPKLKSVNHLHHEGSQLVEGPLAHLAEGAYAMWMKIRDGWHRLMRWLYPRRNVIFGTRKDSRVVGRITFAKRDDQFLPIHHMHLEIWGRTKLGKWRKFSEGNTNADGYFRLPLDMMAVHAYAMRSLRLEIYHTGSYEFVDGKAVPKSVLFETRKINRSSIVGLDYSMGVIQLFYWEYRDDIQMPMVVIRDHDNDAPEKYSEGRVDAISKQFIPVELLTQELLDKIKLGEHLSLADIQKEFPENLTIAMEKEWPGITRSDAWFGLRQMNGMYATAFDRDPERPHLYWNHIHWSSYDHNENFIFPDVSIRYEMLDSGYLLPVEIDLTGPLKVSEKGTKPKRRFTPADGQQWQSAKRIARVSGALATQVDRHFAETHANIEQYAIAVKRNIRKNPIGALLFPHIKEVALINHTADRILIGQNGWLSKSTALSPKGLADRVRDVMGTLDWKGWRPMEPISDKHTYAKASNLYWQVVNQYVDEFIDLHRSEIIDEWHEIYSMSKDLERKSVPKFLCRWLTQRLDPQRTESGNGEPPAWYNQSGRMDLSIRRPVHFGVEKALSPVTKNFNFIEGSDDLDNIRQLCAYIIWQATFGHYWANSKQYDDIGELAYNTLALRFGDTELGALGPDTDDSVALDPKNSVQTMWWANMLSRTGYGFIIKNEDHDISPRFIELLKEKEQEFEALEVDIYDIQSRTNI